MRVLRISRLSLQHVDNAEAGVDLDPRKDVAVLGVLANRLALVALSGDKLGGVNKRGPMMGLLTLS